MSIVFAKEYHKTNEMVIHLYPNPEKIYQQNIQVIYLFVQKMVSEGLKNSHK